MAFYGRDRLEIKETGQTVNVPNTSTAHLMYYFDCVCVLLDLDDDRTIQRYRNYKNHYNMDKEDKKIIVGLCAMLNPKILINKCMFHSDELCGNNLNQFYKITASKLRLAAADNIVIGGVSRNVTSIMAFKYRWLELNFLEPFEALVRELNVPSPPPPPRPRPVTYYHQPQYTRPQPPPSSAYNYHSSSSDSCCCTIL